MCWIVTLVAGIHRIHLFRPFFFSSTYSITSGAISKKLDVKLTAIDIDVFSINVPHMINRSFFARLLCLIFIPYVSFLLIFSSTNAAGDFRYYQNRCRLKCFIFCIAICFISWWFRLRFESFGELCDSDLDYFDSLPFF